MIYQETTLENFQRITGYNVRGFIDEFLTFIENHSRNIVEYYSGEIKVPNSTSFEMLFQLRKEGRTVTELMSLNKEAFTNVADWNLLDSIEDINHTLNVWSRISKFLRSPIINLTYNQGIESPYITREHQTIEDVSRTELKDFNFDNGWAQVAIQNDMREEGYSMTGGALLRVVYNKATTFNYITAVVDNIQGERMYGIDLTRKIEFASDDLSVLGYFDTAMQSAKILCGLKKGDVPEFPEDGVTSNAVVGKNINAIAFPIIFRQFYKLFAKDDTFSAFSLVNIYFEEDSLFIEAEIRTVYGDILTEKIDVKK